SPQTVLHRGSPPSLSLALWDRADLMDCSRGWMLVRRPPVSAFDVRAPTPPGNGLRSSTVPRTPWSNLAPALCTPLGERLQGCSPPGPPSPTGQRPLGVRHVSLGTPQRTIASA